MKFILNLNILILLVSPILAIPLDNTPSYPKYLPISTFSSPPPHSSPLPDMGPLKPSMAIIVAVLTTMFSVTFLLLLYAKHCKRGNNGHSDLTESYSPGTVPPKNSGVDRKIIESLPVFRFGSLKGEKDGLECAVCLGRFEQTEVLRLLPKCKHAFHVECVDTWLEAHSTCPLCRYKVEPEDILLVGRDSYRHCVAEAAGKTSSKCCPLPPQQARRVSGRHSSAGESSAGERGKNTPLQIIVEPSLARRSCDNWRGTRKDGVLLECKERSSDKRKLEHRIVIEGSGIEIEKRWSDIQPSDLLYLRSEMIMSKSRPPKHNEFSYQGGRSVSEITGVSRFAKTTTHQGVLSRWLAQSQSAKDTYTRQSPAVR